VAKSISEEEVMFPIKTGSRQVNGRFQKGKSGNPGGRPKGARAKATTFTERMIEGEQAEITSAVIEAAKAGDPTAMRLCMERICPVRARTVDFPLPPIETAGDVVKALGLVIQAMACGNLAPDEALKVAALIAEARKAIETGDLEDRLQKLEARTRQ
jgi:Family of unknown function (DUF5681)